MSYIQQFFTSRDNNANSETFVGQEGRLWWDPVTNQIYSSDGNTPGGIPLSGGGGGNGTPGGSNSQVQFNQNGAFGGSANLTFNRVTGSLTAVSFVGNGEGLTSVTGANITGTVANATYAVSAGSATTAATVTANAQPNITSVGTLTSITSSGDLSTTGNVSGNYFIGNGSLLTGIASSSYSNTNVSAYLASGTDAANIITTANISGAYILGNGSQLTGIAASSYGNANVVANLAALGSNPISTTGNVTSNYFIGNGSLLTGIAGGSSNKIFNGTSYANIATVNGNVVVAADGKIWNFSTDGTLTLPAGAVLRDSTTSTLALGNDAGNVTNTQDGAIAIGWLAGSNGQNYDAVAIGSSAGGSVGVQGQEAVAIGASAGANAQSIYAVAIGSTAGQTAQGSMAVAVGVSAGTTSQGNEAVAVGDSAGETNQGLNAVAIGSTAGGFAQGNSAVAIGQAAGQSNQGINSVAIGQGAGLTNQGNNAIELNATGLALNITRANTFSVAPVRNDVANIGEILFYNNTSKEVTYGNTVNIAGNIIGSYFIGNGSALTSITGANVSGIVANSTYAVSAGSAATVTNNAQPNITSVGILTSLSSSGNVTGANINGNGSGLSSITGGNVTGQVPNALVSGTVYTAAQPNITSVGILTSLSASGNVTGGNVITVGDVSAASVSTSGNITGANINGNGSGISSITGGNVTGQVGNALVAGTVYTAAQPNITSVGTLTSLSASGNVTGGNLITAGVVSASGNVTGGNVITVGDVSAASVSASGNVTSGNLITAGVVSAASVSSSGNVTGGNLITAGVVSSSGNVTGGNLITAGVVSASGNVTGGNVLYSTGQVSGTGNIYANNIAATNQISAAGNIIGNAELYIGYGATTTGLTNPIIVAQATGLAYVQVAAKNTSPTGSADLIAYADNGNDARAWSDIGMTGSGFNDTAYTITNANDGYVFVQGNTDGTGGNLVLATGDLGAAADLVFATGGFLDTNEKMRFINATGQFDIETTTAASNTTTGALRVRGGAGIAGNIYAGSLISAAGNIITTANVAGGNILTSGQVSTSGNVIGGNVSAGTGIISTSGNITGGNVLAGTGVISTSGNITGGNIITSAAVSAASVTASGNVTGGNVNTNNLVGTALQIKSTGNLDLSATGNITINNTYINGVALNPVQDQDVATKYYVDTIATTGLAFHDPVFAATTTTLATTTGGTISYTQPNGAGNGVGALLTTTGSFNLIDTANVQTLGKRILVKNEANAVYNGVYTWANATNIVRSTDADEYGFNSVEQLSLNDYFFVQDGNVNKGSAYVVNSPTGTITFGTSNITFSEFSSSQTYTANTAAGISITGTVINAKTDNISTAFDGTGNIVVKAGAVLTTPNIGAAVATSVSATGNVTGGNVITGGIVSATGNITGSYIIGNGSQLTGLPASYSDANVAAYLPTYTGNLVSLTGPVITTANITGGNINTGGIVSATGNIVSIANVSGGNVLSSALIQGAILSASGNVNGGNLTTPGTISSTGNITSSGNISGGNILGNGYQLTRVRPHVTATDSGGALNIMLASGFNGPSNAVVGIGTSGGPATINPGTGQLVVAGATVGGYGLAVNGGSQPLTGTVSATGNITGANFITTGLISVTGNITAGNVLGGANVNATTHTGTTVSVTGNITAGNISTTGLLSGSNNLLINAPSPTAEGAQIVMAWANISGLSGQANSTWNIDVNATNDFRIFYQNAIGGTGVPISITQSTNAVSMIGALSAPSLTVSTGTVTLGNITNANGNGVGNIGAVGGYFNTVFAKATSAQYADLAEMYVADAAYSTGTVLIFGGEQEVTADMVSHSTAIAGVVSENPSYLMNSGLQGEHVAVVALLGRVPCQVQGVIRKGDLLVASSTAGVAQRLDPAQYQPGCVIGKALANYDSEVTGMIEIAVGVK